MSNLSTYILLDRSGSMTGERWTNAINSINEYVGTLKAGGQDGRVTVAAFDGSGFSYSNTRTAYNNEFNENNNVNFTVLRDGKKISKFKSLKETEIDPRGSTPLFDATARLLNMAEQNNGEKTIIIIMTDGEENSSRDYNMKSIKDRLKGCEHRGWEVIFLGAEFNADKTAQNLGINISKVVNNRSAADIGDTMRFYAASAMSYTNAGQAIDTTSLRNDLESKGK